MTKVFRSGTTRRVTVQAQWAAGGGLQAAGNRIIDRAAGRIAALTDSRGGSRQAGGVRLTHGGGRRRGLFAGRAARFLPDDGVDTAPIDTPAAACLRIAAACMTAPGEALKLPPGEQVGVARRFIAAIPGRRVIVGVSAAEFTALTVIQAGATMPNAVDREGVMPAPSPGRWLVR